MIDYFLGVAVESKDDFIENDGETFGDELVPEADAGFSSTF